MFQLYRMCTYAEGFLLHYCVALFSPYISGRKKTKNTKKYHILSLISVPLWRNRPAKIRSSLSQMYEKLRSIQKKGRFHDKPLQLVQNVHRFDSSAIGSHVTFLGLMPIQHESEICGEKHGSGVICISLQKGPGTKMSCSVIQH